MQCSTVTAFMKVKFKFMSGFYSGVWGETSGKETSWKIQCRWEDNIKKELREMGWWHGQDRSGSVDGQVAGSCDAVMNLRVQ